MPVNSAGNKVLDHMSTANVARDLDLLRQAVGDEQLTYAGYSYGSYLGVTYANLFPDKVRGADRRRRAQPDRLEYRRPWRGEPAVLVPTAEQHRSPGHAWRSSSACATRPARRPAPSRRTRAARYQAIAEYLLDNEPLAVTVPAGPNGELVEIPFFYGDLIGMTLGAMYDSFSWPVVAEDLAFLEAAIAGAPAAAPATLRSWPTVPGVHRQARLPPLFQLRRRLPGRRLRRQRQSGHDADWVAAAGDISFDDYFRQIWTYASSPCLAFPTTGEDRYIGPFDADTANPVLVASTLYDPATPVHGALEVNEILPNSGLCSSMAGDTPRSGSPSAPPSSASDTSSPRNCHHRRAS